MFSIASDVHKFHYTHKNTPPMYVHTTHMHDDCMSDISM